MPGRRSLYAAALAVHACVAGGCVDPVEFDARGSDVAVQAAWTIEGQPASATTCGAAGATHVQVVFLDQGTAFNYPELTFECAAGAGTTGPVVRHGVFDVQLSAVDCTLPPPEDGAVPADAGVHPCKESRRVVAASAMIDVDVADPEDSLADLGTRDLETAESR